MKIHNDNDVQQELLHAMTRLVAWGTFVMVGALALLLLINILFVSGASALPRLGITLGIVAAVGVIVKISYGRHVVYASWLLLATYGLIAAGVLYVWGVNIPFGLLLLSLVIALAGVMLGSRAILVTVFGAVLLLILLQLLFQQGVIRPNLINLALPPSFGDVAGHGVLFSIIALASWLSRNHMERSLQRAIVAEKALQREKDALARRLNRRTKQLRQAQIEEMRQLYRFADLGQMSAALLHELANHLAVVTLSIDDLERQHRQSREIDRAKEGINDLELLIAQMRTHLKSDDQQYNKQFNILELVDGDVIRRMKQKAWKSHVTLSVIVPKHRKKIMIRGDRGQFEQVLGIICTNAIESYEGVLHSDKTVRVVVHSKKDEVVIEVIDEGEGVAKEKITTLFQPQTSKKRHGMGIGLYLARQIMESHFKGKIQYKRSNKATVFLLTLPSAKILD